MGDVRWTDAVAASEARALGGAEWQRTLRLRLSFRPSQVADLHQVAVAWSKATGKRIGPGLVAWALVTEALDRARGKAPTIPLEVSVAAGLVARSLTPELAQPPSPLCPSEPSPGLGVASLECGPSELSEPLEDGAS